MSKKWYNLFVSVEPGPGSEETASPAGEAGSPDASAARTVAEIAASIAPETHFSAPVTNPNSFDEIYRAAEIQAAPHGYTILKVAEMLGSEHIRGLPAEVRRNAVLVALEAAGVKITQVIEDAVRRDRALDTYERVLEKSLEELKGRKTGENRQIQEEMDRVIGEYRARMQANSEEVARQEESFYGWRLGKQQEEKKIADAVAYFVSENPITSSGAAAAPRPEAKSQAS
jgi:hypothetical protein